MEKNYYTTSNVIVFQFKTKLNEFNEFFVLEIPFSELKDPIANDTLIEFIRFDVPFLQINKHGNIKRIDYKIFLSSFDVKERSQEETNIISFMVDSIELCF